MSELWAITTYFNPCAWQSRRRNYHSFRRHLNVPLLTVEWHPEGRFELSPSDADRLIQVSGGSLLWQKERLLNIALSQLPREATQVAWLDCAMLFCDPDWAQRTRDALERVELLQPFSRACYLNAAQTAALGDHVEPRELASGASVPSAMQVVAFEGAAALVEADLRGQRSAALPDAGTRLPRIPGIAWCARRALLDDIGIFDRGVVGSGDLFFLLGVLGVAEHWLEHSQALGFGYLAHSNGYRAWAARAAQRAAARVGVIDSAVLHLHHGELADRHYKARHRAFDALGIDIDRDLSLSSSGVWAVSDEHKRSSTTSFFEQYFRSRHEDGRPQV